MRVIGDKDKPLFNAKDVCSILGLDNNRMAIKNLNENQRTSRKFTTPGGPQNCTFLTESGVFKLIFKSKKQEAIQFQNFVCDDVLPSIRAHGIYPPPLCDVNVKDNKTITLYNEKSLQIEVVRFIKNQLHDPFNMVVCCPEFQDTEAKRIEAKCKGYVRGCPDLIICTPNKEYNGFALEFKNPNGSGTLSDSQKNVLKRFEDDGYKVLISNDFSEIVYQLTKFKFQMNK
jgi:prophage antirepressor-like protein